MRGIVDITEKLVVRRVAIAEGKIILGRKSIELARENLTPKGRLDELILLSAIHGVKEAPRVIFHAHPIPIEGINVEHYIEENGIRVRVTVKTTGKTGVEMDALNGVMAALINIFDTYKPVEKDKTGNYPVAKIVEIKVVKKIKEEIKGGTQKA